MISKFFLLVISSISSNEAAYDENGLKLKGHICIEHPLGKMETEEALVEKRDEQPEEFKTIHLMKAVRITLQDYGNITCEKADFDLTTLTGNLQSKEGEKVRYSRALKNNQTLHILSSAARVQFQSEHEQPLLQTLFAEGGVEVSYGDGYSLQCEYAEFQKTLLTAFPSPNRSCRLTHETDCLEAERFELYPEESKIAALHPKGSFGSLSVSKESPLSFECDQLIWNHQQHSLQFNSAIVIRDPTLGEVRAAKGVAQCEERSLASFELEGEVLLSKSEERCGLANQLTYSQSTHTVNLKAAKGERVLFWDKPKGLAISASEVEITRDPETHEERIKGIGSVRFHFSEAENALLKQLFPAISIPAPEEYADPAS